jgi:hypothetical protein
MFCLTKPNKGILPELSLGCAPRCHGGRHPSGAIVCFQSLPILAVLRPFFLAEMTTT